MKKGQSVLQAAQKLAEQHIRKSINQAIDPISDEIKQYISTLVEADLPEKAQEILMMDIHDIVATALDFVEMYQTNNGIRVEINLEGLTSLLESITSLVNHNPKYIEETLEYFNNLEIDVKTIEGIVISNINNVL
jgi:Na+/phosphate symporter